MNVNTDISNAFNRQAKQYEQSAIMQHEIGLRLFERLDYLKIEPQWILDLGCGPGYFSKRLKKKYPQATVVGFDLAFQMLKEAKAKQQFLNKWPLLNGDMSEMPFTAELFDLVFANQVIHWSPAWPTLMKELNRVMTVNGCLMFSTLGPDTFCEIKDAWSGIDEHAHANDYIDMHHIGDYLLGHDFLDPVVDMEYLTAHYESAQHLVTALKHQGVRNIHQERRRGLTGRHAWNAFLEKLSVLQTAQGKVPLTYEVYYGHAWKGEPRQKTKGTETLVPLSQLKRNKL